MLFLYMRARVRVNLRVNLPRACALTRPPTGMRTFVHSHAHRYFVQDHICHEALKKRCPQAASVKGFASAKAGQKKPNQHWFEKSWVAAPETLFRLIR